MFSNKQMFSIGISVFVSDIYFRIYLKYTANQIQLDAMPYAIGKLETVTHHASVRMTYTVLI